MRLRHKMDSMLQLEKMSGVIRKAFECCLFISLDEQEA